LKKLIYIAGPYTQGDPVINVRNAIDVGAEILMNGHVPVIPHLTMFFHLVYPHPIEVWYEYDLAILERCDVLVRLPGRSTGADKEVDHATKHDIPVTFGMDELWRWVDGQ